MFKETEVDECEIIVIGHLKWNPYFGEKKEDPPRGDPSTCTSVLVSGRQMDGKPFRMLIDPTQRLCAQDYYFDLNRRTGLHPQDITHCFCTHEHFDHQVGLNYFRNTIWLAAEPVAEKLLNSVYINGKKYRELKESFYLELRRFGCRDTQRQYMEFHFGIRADMY